MERAALLLMVGIVLAILMLILPVIGVVSVFLTTGALTLYYTAIAGGLYKEPLLAEFRKYGTEPAICPLGNALLAGGVCLLTMGGVLPLIAAQGSFLVRLLPGAIFTALGLVLIAGGVVVYWRPELRTALPPWYTFLIQHATRQERRHIGWAWLRLPFKMRIRLNGDTKSFSVWVELVRLTVIYGAYDPDSPWHRWT